MGVRGILSEGTNSDPQLGLIASNTLLQAAVLIFQTHLVPAQAQQRRSASSSQDLYRQSDAFRRYLPLVWDRHANSRSFNDIEIELGAALTLPSGSALN